MTETTEERDEERKRSQAGARIEGHEKLDRTAANNCERLYCPDRNTYATYSTYANTLDVHTQTNTNILKRVQTYSNEYEHT